MLRVLVVALLAFAPAAAASAQTGSVVVRLPIAPAVVTDVVAVELRPVDGPESRRVSPVAGVPLVRFDGVRPGEYRVSLLLGGLAIADVSIRIAPQDVVVLDASLAALAVRSGSLAVVSRYREGEGTRFDDALVRDLPAATVWGLIETAAPFVISDRFENGGLDFGRSPLIGGRGESWASTAVSIGDVDLHHPDATGRFGLVPDSAFIETLSVSQGLAPVDVRTPGARIALQPRIPGPVWSGVVHAGATTPGMVARNDSTAAPSIARLESWGDGGIVAGGPLGSRTGLVIAGSAARTRQQERHRDDRLTTRAETFFTHLVSNVRDGDRLRILGGIQAARFPLDGREQFADRTGDVRTHDGQMQVSWDHVGDRGGRLGITGGFQRTRATPDVADPLLGGVVDRVWDGVVPLPAETRLMRAWDARAEVDRPVRQWGNWTHAFRFGASARRESLESTVVAAPVVAETVARQPARVWQPVLPSDASRRHVDDVAVFVADRITTGALAITAGVRLDRSSGRAEGAANGIAWTALAPRVSFAWQPGPVGIFGGYGRYLAAHALPLLAWGDPMAPTRLVSRWTDGNGNGGFDAGEAGVLISREGPGGDVVAIDAGLAAPMSREWTAGAEYRPSAAFGLRGAIVVRRQTGLPGLIDAGVPLAAYRTFEIPDIGGDEGSAADDQLLTVYERLPSSFGDDALLLTTPDGAEATYGGIELTCDLRTDRWTMTFGAMAYRTRGWGGRLGPRATENDQLVLGERYADPNAADDPEGSFFFDRSYVGKWAGTYRAAHDVRVAFVARYQDGQPFSRVVVLPDLATGPEAIQAFRVGRSRYTYSATVDLRVEKGFAVGRGRASVHLDAFNVTNHRNEVEEDVVTGPTFRVSTAVQPPLTLRAGLRWEF